MFFVVFFPFRSGVLGSTSGMLEPGLALRIALLPDYVIITSSLLQVLHDAYGKIDAATVMQLVGKVQTGNLQAVVYDLDVSQCIL